jgi:CheY-like chemotaxis protein
MNPNVVQLRSGPRWRVLIAHQRGDVRHVLRTLIESEHIAVVEAPDGDAALAHLERAKFDMLVLELDLPLRDGITLMQLHRVLLAYEHLRAEPPAVIFTLPPEVRGNTTLTDHLHALGATACIDDSPRPDVAELFDATLHARAAKIAGKPAAA